MRTMKKGNRYKGQVTTFDSVGDFMYFLDWSRGWDLLTQNKYGYKLSF